MPTPPPIPPPTAFPPSPVIPYATPIAPRQWSTDPKLAFISRMSVWLGVLYTLISLPMLLAFVVIATSVSRGDEPGFWISLLLLAGLQMIGGIVMICGAAPARRKRLMLSASGGTATLLTSLGFTAALIYDAMQTNHMDYLPLAFVCLLFTTLSAIVLFSCSRQWKTPTG